MLGSDKEQTDIRATEYLQKNFESILEQIHSRPCFIKDLSKHKVARMQMTSVQSVFCNLIFQQFFLRCQISERYSTSLTIRLCQQNRCSLCAKYLVPAVATSINITQRAPYDA